MTTRFNADLGTTGNNTDKPRKYEEMYRQSIENPEAFWGEQSRKINWYRQWDRVLDWDPPHARWFVGGRLNACYQCVDQHVTTSRRNEVAIYWEGENGETRILTYMDLYMAVSRFAAGLKKLGISKGDRVILYLPMIAELPVAMLACARIGAVHSVVFSGFSSQALSDRIHDTEARLVITADGGYRRGKIVPLKDIVDQAVPDCPSVEKVLVVNRADQDINMQEGRDICLSDALSEGDMMLWPEPVESTHPLFVLYTSGTTGKPKGIVHSTGGYLVHNHSAFEWTFNINEESVYWCTADIGWITGHSQVVYAPLSHGASVVIYEGAPDFPEIDRWWEIVEKYRVTILYTSPTAIRMFMRHGEEWLSKHDLSSLELLGSVGEPINPEAWQWFNKHVGNENCPIIDTWWQTETGGIMIAPAPGIEPIQLKPGSATFPVPGVDIAVVDNDGNEVEPGKTGHLIIRKPWPGMLMNIYGDPHRYEAAYWSRFPGAYHTGDFAMRDEDGYMWMLGRADEVLKVAGHRIGTAEIETAAVGHPAVAEAAVTGKPDDVKGESIVLFATLREGIDASKNLETEIAKHIRKAIGPVATPDEIYFATSLPRTRSGKLMRRVLRAIASGQRVGDLTTVENEASIEEVRKAFETVLGSSEADSVTVESRA